jgi:hypothetical protein
MMRRNSSNRKGQALFYAIPWIVALLGAAGLALDAGWAFYKVRKAQTAVDAAAMAAVSAANANLSAGAVLKCGGGVQCMSAGTDCPAGGNLQVACDYAARNGFTHGGDEGRQSMTVEASLGTNPAGVSYLPASSYWVQVTARHQMPPWLSTILGQAGLTASARATASIYPSKASDSIYLLNRKDDCFVSLLNLGLVCGENLLMLGGNRIDALSGIRMASSNKSGIGLPRIAAATIVGSGTVVAPHTYLVGNGGVQALGSVSWTAAPVNQFTDTSEFRDPMIGKGQPPVPGNLPDRPVPGGVITGGLFPWAPKYLPPGHYYATTPAVPLVPSTPTGVPVVVTGNVVFSDGASTPCGGFCEYVFHGGLVTAALSTVTVAPGRYVIAGAQAVAGGPGAGLSVGVNSTLKDMTPLLSGNRIGPPNDAGEIFIFTDSKYPTLHLPFSLAGAGISLPQARAGVVTLGLGAKVILHGLNADSPHLPSELQKFAPALIWQDQANTTLRYTASGQVDNSCAGGCTKLLEVPGSQEMIIGASSNGSGAATHLYGTVYGPRQSWLTISGLVPGDTIEGPLQIVTGALQMTLNTRLDLRVVDRSISTVSMAMVQ